ncbi:MAG: formate dehydrogenase [Variovorax sp.]
MQDSHSTGLKPASRRGFFIGAATVGAVAAAVTVLPKVGTAPVTAAPMLKPPPENGGGYSLSEHVKRYYQTTSA